MIDRRSHAGSPEAALAALVAGNRRFVHESPLHPNQDARRRADTADGQAPFAVLVGCSDSRVAAEIVFDCGLGDLFVVRTAGHMIDAAVLASVEFALDALKVPLVLVLAHDRCGAVAATLRAVETGDVPGGCQRVLVDSLMPDVRRARDAGIADVDAIARYRASVTAQQLVTGSAVIAEAAASGRCLVAAGHYRLAVGLVELTDQGVGRS